MNIPTISIIENMSEFICLRCGAESDVFKVGGANERGKTWRRSSLRRIPIDSKICENSDKGIPFIVKHAKIVQYFKRR